MAKNEYSFATLEDIEAYPKPFLTADQVAQFLECNPQNIRSQAQADATLLGFPVIVMGSSVRIPRLGFCSYIRYGRPVVQTPRAK